MKKLSRNSSLPERNICWVCFHRKTFWVTKWEHGPRADSKEAAGENLKAGAEKVKVYGWERMKVTLPSWMVQFGSCSAGISYVFQDWVCLGARLAKVKSCVPSLTLGICQTHLSYDWEFIQLRRYALKTFLVLHFSSAGFVLKCLIKKVKNKLI